MSSQKKKKKEEKKKFYPILKKKKLKIVHYTRKLHLSFSSTGMVQFQKVIITDFINWVGLVKFILFIWLVTIFFSNWPFSKAQLYIY